MEVEAYCRWHDKKMQDVAEYEHEQCEKQEWNCKDCPYFGEKDGGEDP